MFTQTAERLGNRGGEEVSRLCVCLLQLPAQKKKKKPGSYFSPAQHTVSRGGEDDSKHGKTRDHTNFILKFQRRIRQSRDKQVLLKCIQAYM